MLLKKAIWLTTHNLNMGLPSTPVNTYWAEKANIIPSTLGMVSLPGVTNGIVENGIHSRQESMQTAIFYVQVQVWARLCVIK